LSINPVEKVVNVNIDLYKTLAGVIVGFVIGLTGMGGGALMTPVLVIIFGVNPGAAVSSDVITSLALKPFGAGVHARRGTINWRLVRWLALGSVPAAFVGSYLLDALWGSNHGDAIKKLLGWVLLVAAAAILAKVYLQNRRQNGPNGDMMPESAVRPLPTLAIGIVGGLIVGMTSVGSGSLIIVMLMTLYPKLSSKEMVGTDLMQAIPLVGAAAVGHWIFGSPSYAVIASVLIGAIPAVMVGAHFSSRVSDFYVRPALVCVLLLSSLSLLGVANGWLLTLVIVEVLGYVAYVTRARAARTATQASPIPAHAA
jgi:uncharacterized membrane protein YfcA